MATDRDPTVVTAGPDVVVAQARGIAAGYPAELVADRRAYDAYKKLLTRDKWIVQAWRELGNSWFDSVVNSGVLKPGRRIRPHEYKNAKKCEELPG
jgi:hypothetical protein